jgi:hypothetical protein
MITRRDAVRLLGSSSTGAWFAATQEAAKHKDWHLVFILVEEQVTLNLRGSSCARYRDLWSQE